jgi:hypothetical protein
MPGQKGQSWAKAKGQPSKENVQCIVCERQFRRDKINTRHYVRMVKLDAENKPVRPGSLSFNRIEDEDMKIHTEYFYKNNLDPFNTKVCAPSARKSSVKLSPFEEMERRKLLKRPHGSEESSSSTGIPPTKIQRKLNLVS